MVEGGNGPHPGMTDLLVVSSSLKMHPPHHTLTLDPVPTPHTNVARLAVPLLKVLRGAGKNKENLPSSSKRSVRRLSLGAAAPRWEDCPTPTVLTTPSSLRHSAHPSTTSSCLKQALLPKDSDGAACSRLYAKMVTRKTVLWGVEVYWLDLQYVSNEPKRKRGIKPNKNP